MTCTSSKDSDQLVYSCSLISLHWVLYGQPRNQGFFRQTAKTEALPRVLGNRGIRPFISWEQGNKSLKLKGTGEQRQFWGTGNVENQDFDFGKQGNVDFFFRGTKEQVPPTPTGRAAKLVRLCQCIGWSDSLLCTSGAQQWILFLCFSVLLALRFLAWGSES